MQPADGSGRLDRLEAQGKSGNEDVEPVSYVARSHGVRDARKDRVPRWLAGRGRDEVRRTDARRSSDEWGTARRTERERERRDVSTGFCACGPQAQKAQTRTRSASPNLSSGLAMGSVSYVCANGARAMTRTELASGASADDAEVRLRAYRRRSGHDGEFPKAGQPEPGSEAETEPGLL